jgi:hypothetical protein
LPIPCPEPVTIATLPFSLSVKIILLSHYKYLLKQRYTFCYLPVG